jgi:predicted transcriptional regulator
LLGEAPELLTVAPASDKRYHEAMAKAKDFDLDNPAPAVEDEDEKTLAAIDEGMRDAKAGRTSPIEEVRKLLPKWIAASSSRKGR